MTVYTTGQVAKICKVAPRTVSNWFDSGRLKGYRVPGSQDRRIPRQNLIAFLKEHGVPLEDLGIFEAIKLLIVSRDESLIRDVKQEFSVENDFDFAIAGNGFEAGEKVADFRPSCVVVDFSIGTKEAWQICSTLRNAPRSTNVVLIALWGDDENSEVVDRKVFKDIFRKPFDMTLFAERLRTLTADRKETLV